MTALRSVVAAVLALPLALAGCATEQPAQVSAAPEYPQGQPEYPSQVQPQYPYQSQNQYPPGYSGERQVTVATPPGTQGGAVAPVVIPGDTVQPGTRLFVRLDQPIGAGLSQPGQTYSATVVSPLVDNYGNTILPAGGQVIGRVEQVASPQSGQPAAVALTVDALRVGNVDHPIQANIVGTDVQAPHRGIRPEWIVGGAAGGAVLGAILGGSARSAILGGALGAGAGTLISLGTSGSQTQLPAGTGMAVQLTAPLSVAALRYAPHG